MEGKMSKETTHVRYKFRAWDKVSKSWLENFKVYQEGNVSSDGTWLLNSEVVLCQFTGLHDKNGDELYENDIVRFWGGIGKIIYFTPYAAFRIEYQGQDVFDINEGQSIEILGNVFQNHQLLEG